MGMIKFILHLGRVIKCIEWMMMKRKLKAVGDNARIGMNFSIRGAEYIALGKNFSGGDNLSLWTWGSYKGIEQNQTPDLSIGDDVTVTSNCVISCANKIAIGDGTLLGRGTLVTDKSHGKNSDIAELNIPPNRRMLYSKGSVIIGKNVWTGTNVCIMPGVTIGDGVVIGANSVVTHDIPAYSIAVGAPAKIIRRVEGNGL